VAEYFLEELQKLPARSRRGDWGGWRREGLYLVYPAYPNGGVYPFNLEHFTRSSVMLDMIMQVAKKPWATDACLAGLVRAFSDLFQPQATLCSCGMDKRLTRTQIRKLVKRRC
jgi:hypothetical protein